MTTTSDHLQKLLNTLSAPFRDGPSCAIHPYNKRAMRELNNATNTQLPAAIRYAELAMDKAGYSPLLNQMIAKANLRIIFARITRTL